MAEDKSIINYDNIIAPTDTFDVLFKNIDILEARLKKLAKEYNDGLDLLNVNDTAAIEKQVIAIRKLELAEEKLRLKKEALARAQKKKIELTQEELVQAQAEKIQNQERIKRAKQLAIIRTQERNTIKSLRAQLSLVTLDWSKLTEEEIKNNKVIDENGRTARSLVKDKKRLTEQLKRLEKQTGDNRRNVGNYTKSLGLLSRVSKGARNDLTKLALRLSIGRSVVDGVASAFRNAAQGLRQLVEEGDGTNEVFNQLESSGSRLKATLNRVGTEFLGAFGSGIAKIIDNVAFVISVVSNSLIEASESTGFFGSILRGVGEILTNFPAIFGGIVEASREFIAGTSRAFSSFSLNVQLAYQNFLLLSKGIAGFDTAETERNIQNLTRDLEQNAEGARSLGQAYTDGYNATIAAQEEFNKQSEQEAVNQQKIAEARERRTKAEKAAEAARKKQIQESKRVLGESPEKRIKAIEDLQKALEKTETGNIKNRQEKVLSLEQLRFKEEQKQREQNFISFVAILEAQEEALINLYGKNDERVIAFREEAGKELLRVEKLNLDLSEEQLEKSEQNKLDIRKKFALSTKEIATIDALGQDSAIEEVLNKEVSLVEEANEKKKDSYEDLSKSIVESTEAASEAIQGIFDQELKAATDAVEAQETAVSSAEARAQAGLENSLKFEQEQLAQKELERQQAEKRAQQAAEALALINLTVAAAQSGDQNAVQTGLVQFGVLKGLIAAIGGAQGFYEGTEHIGNSLGNKGKFFNGNRDSYLAITDGGTPIRVDGTERIVPGGLNSKIGSMSNEELIENALLGAAKTDYKNPTMLLGASHFKEQTRQVLSISESPQASIDVSGLKDEMRATRRAIEKKPVVQETLTRVIKDVAEISRKTTINRMTRTEVIKNRL